MTNDLRYLFICGCPRSGTTALWRLLASHPKTVLGMERFGGLIGKEWSLSPTHYEKQRFFDIREGDTFYKSIDHFPIGSGIPQLFRSMEGRFGSHTHAGDKLPYLFYKFQNLADTFPGVDVVFALRDIYDVANSFVKRQQDPGDRWKLGVEDAVRFWRDALVQAARPRENLKFHVVVYENFFGDDERYKSKLFEQLSLPLVVEVEEAISRISRKSHALVQTRKQYLTSEDMDYIQQNAPFELYKEVCAKARS